MPIGIGALGLVPEVLEIKLKTIGSQSKNRAPQNNNIIEAGLNTLKNPGDLRDFVVTQTQVKDHSWLWCGKLTRSIVIEMNADIHAIKVLRTQWKLTLF